MSMIDPSIVELQEKVGARYTLVIATAKRARQLAAGEESLVQSNSNKHVTVAIEEINQGKVKVVEKE